MKAVSLNFLSNIKESFKKFQRAHIYKKVLHQNTAEIIAFNILKKVKLNMDRIY